MFEPVVTYCGRLGGPVKSGTSDSGTDWASFSLAVQPKDKDPQTGRLVDGPTTWVRVSCFKGTARNVAASLDKGDLVIVVGRQRSGSYEKDGVTHQSLEVQADYVGADLSLDAWVKQADTPLAAGTGGGGSAQPGGFESYGGFAQPQGDGHAPY
ncbi:single-stranded DNA-binding protein [Nesterenkonia flava]|uniref:Single-stranded DNA-binding protein n=1 Tax=Nesterenkonia flava TaxID=469799 RepID=A0ABU1FWH3_9MICC|nr:single-stranded DNA-binding protein [Nesterenkonia flava]MDR5712958.1 single-stranded DNA-binding protein [Nesterenkonia flava]